MNIKSLNKGVSTPFAIFIILVCALLVGWSAVWQYKEMEKNKGPEIITPEEAFFPEEEPEQEIDTSDWRIYRNEEYGFEVKYPKNWIFRDIRQETLRNLEEGKYPAGKSPRIPLVDITFQSPDFSQHSEPVTSEEERKELGKVKWLTRGARFSLWIESGGPGFEPDSEPPSFFDCNSYPVLKSTVQCPLPNGHIEFPYVEAYSLQSTQSWKHFIDAWEARTSFSVELYRSFSDEWLRTYHFHLTYNEDYPRGEKVFNQILSTFKFLD